MKNDNLTAYIPLQYPRFCSYDNLRCISDIHIFLFFISTFHILTGVDTSFPQCILKNSVHQADTTMKFSAAKMMEYGTLQWEYFNFSLLTVHSQNFSNSAPIRLPAFSRSCARFEDRENIGPWGCGGAGGSRTRGRRGR